MNLFGGVVVLVSLCIGVAVGSGCWTTGCNLNSWAQVGCSPFGLSEKKRVECPGGYIYECCPQSEIGDGSGSGDGGGSGSGSEDKGGPLSSLTFEQFSNAITSNSYPDPGREKYDIFKSSATPKGSISSLEEGAMALAQFLHESDGLRAKREYACQHTSCPGSYATAGCDAPGQYYYGRGYIQLSWCYNYRPASMDLYGDDRLVHDPDMVAREEQVAWDTAFWYWKTAVHSQPGVSDGKFGVTTRAINGALECWGGHADQARARFEIYKKVRTAFGLTGPAFENGCYN